MKKYIRPEMECRIFERENILTASGGAGTHESSAEALKNELSNSMGVSPANIMEDLW